MEAKFALPFAQDSPGLPLAQEEHGFEAQEQDFDTCDIFMWGIPH